MTVLASLRLLRLEAALTAMVISMPVMNLFFASIGMDQGQIGLSQSLFMAALLMLNVPNGWLADRFSHKWANFLGDAICAVGFAAYAMAQSFAWVVGAEIIIGIGMSLSQGADDALLVAYARSLKRSLRGEQSYIQLLRPLAEAGAVLLGGVIGSYDIRLTLAVAAVPYALGALVSLFMIDASPRLERQHRNPFKDMAIAVTTLFKGNPKLTWYVIASAVARESTHPLVWVLTPILLLVGVPVAWMGVAWATNMVLVMFGAWLAGRVSDMIPPWLRFALPMAVVLLTCTLLAVHVGVATVLLYGSLGVVRGWVSVTMPVLVFESAPAHSQATVSSVAKSFSGLLYIPLAWVINAAGTNNIQGSFLLTVVMFAPACGLVTWQLWKRRE